MCARCKDHVAKLGAKAYWDQFPASPEMVVLFLPAEAIYMAALEQDALLIDYGVSRNVIIASPLTLIALLRAVGVRMEAGTADHQRGGDQPAWARRCTRAWRRWRSTSKTCGGAWMARSSTFNRVIGSFESNVLVKARRFRELGAGSAKEIPLIDPLETVARKLDAPTQQGLLDNEETEATSGERS